MSHTLNFPNILNKPELITIRNSPGFVYWRLPDSDAKYQNSITLERFGKSIKAAFRPYKKLMLVKELFRLDAEERAERFLSDFFLSSFDTAIPANLANLSLTDNSEKRISGNGLPFQMIV